MRRHDAVTGTTPVQAGEPDGFASNETRGDRFGLTGADIDAIDLDSDRLDLGNDRLDIGRDRMNVADD